MVSVYVNDFLLAASKQNSIKKALQDEYNVKDLREVKTIIGWQVTQGLFIIKIDQLTFIRDLIEEEGIQDYNPVNTPMKAGNFIEMQDEDDYKKVNPKMY